MSLFGFGGKCEICGCTEDNPCYNPKHGFCGWADDTRTICTHCADKEIAEDPETEHCVNDSIEAQVILLSREGKTNEQISDELGLGEMYVAEIVDRDMKGGES